MDPSDESCSSTEAAEELIDSGAVDCLVTEYDLTGMGIRLSVVHENLSEGGTRRALAGFHTLSPILEAHDLRKTVRFLNTAPSRIENDGGLVIFVIDSTAHEMETRETISQVCDGYVEIRGTETDGNEIRIHGLTDQPRGWLTVPAPLLGPDSD